MIDQPSGVDEGMPVQRITLGELDPASGSGRQLFEGNNMDVIRNVKVRVSVSAGRCEMTIQELFDLKEGSVVPLDKATRDPVDVLIDGKVVARGNLVAVGDNFGVRISEVISS